MNTELPARFADRMREMLGEEYDAYLESFQKPRLYGLRRNPLKIRAQELENKTELGLKPIPWVTDGYFYPERSEEHTSELQSR